MAHRAVVRYIRKSRGTAKQRERQIQRSLTMWLRYELPGIDFYNDWASGAYLTEGQNTARMSLASRNGWVDLFIAEPRRGYHGLFLELKKEGVRPYLKDGSPSKDKKLKKEHEFIARQESKGFCARFACGLDEAKSIINWYFERPETLEMF